MSSDEALASFERMLAAQEGDDFMRLLEFVKQLSPAQRTTLTSILDGFGHARCRPCTEGNHGDCHSVVRRFRELSANHCTCSCHMSPDLWNRLCIAAGYTARAVPKTGQNGY